MARSPRRTSLIAIAPVRSAPPMGYPAFLTTWPSSEGAIGFCRRRKPPERVIEEAQPRRGGRNALSFRPFGAGHSFPRDPAAYAAGNILSSLRDLGCW